MTKDKPIQKQLDLDIALTLFKSTNRLNLSRTYEAIPKSVHKNDPAINWETETIAGIVEKPFFINDEEFFSEIAPAMLRNPKTRETYTKFPGLREDKVESAVIELATEAGVKIGADKNNNTIIKLATTYYKIQKKIVAAVNKKNNKNYKARECQFNTTEIKESLDILADTRITVKKRSDPKNAVFKPNRINDLYRDDDKVIITLGGMVSDYISAGNWLVVDGDGLLAAKGRYQFKAQKYVSLHFRHAAPNKILNIGFQRSLIILDYISKSSDSIAFSKITKIYEKLDGISKVTVRKKIVGGKFVDGVHELHADEKFIKDMIHHNQLKKRTKQFISGDDGMPLLQPISEDFDSSAEFNRARVKYEKLIESKQ